MPVRNGNFAEVGPAPGTAMHWTMRSFVRAERVAGFGPAPERGVEDFERWHALSTVLELTERAFFDARPEGFEDFSDGFRTDTFAWDFVDTTNERLMFQGDSREAFESSFGNDNFVTEWNDAGGLAARFGGATREAFERGHRNDVYALTLNSVLISPARFNGQIAETFAASWPEHDARGGDLHG